MRFDELPEEDARALLLRCMAAPDWVEEVLGGRPYRSVDELLEVADQAARDLSEDDLEAALAGHPRIGERAAAGHNAAASAREQAGVVSTSATTQKLVEGNQAYEERFGHVYLVRAAGRSGEQMLALLRARLGNDDATERDVVRDQLAEITSLRLRRLWEEGEV